MNLSRTWAPLGRFLVVTLATSAALASSVGCTHVTSKFPGVLDMRSDASEIPANTAAPKGGPRDGLDAILWGDGVQGSGTVTIQDRKYWVIGLIPVFNDSATEEIQAAVGDGVLRKVTVGEQLTFMNMAEGVCVPSVLGVCTFGIGTVVSLVLPPLDFKVTGQRAKLVADAAPSESHLPDVAPSDAPPVVPTPSGTSDIPPLTPGEE